MDVGKIGMKKHHIKALIEIDVTDSRKKLRDRRRELNKPISFTAWILKCIGKAIDEHKQVQALRKGRNKLVIFNEVDISVMVEKKIDNDMVPIPLIIRNINKLDLIEVTKKIDEAKNAVIKNENDYVLTDNRTREPIRLFSFLPQTVRLLLWRIFLSNPHHVKKMMGTAIVTSVGMFGKVSGWIIPFSIHPVCFALGSVIDKPGVVENQVKIRKFLEMTVLIDHDVIDGAPAARFVARLNELMEKGQFL